MAIRYQKQNSLHHHSKPVVIDVFRFKFMSQVRIYVFGSVLGVFGISPVEASTCHFQTGIATLGWVVPAYDRRAGNMHYIHELHLMLHPVS